MLINLSNHPSDSWTEKQKSATSLYGEVVDMPFPMVDPMATDEYIDKLSDEYLDKILQAKGDAANITVHIMGELTFSFALIKKLQQKNILCIASTSKRISIDKGDGKKEVVFDFQQFREYL